MVKKISVKEAWHRLNMDINIYAKYNRIEKISCIKWLSCLCTPPIQAMLFYRLAYFFLTDWPIITRFFYTLNLILYGIDIWPASEIGGGCYIPHPSGVVIYGKLGENVFLSQAVGIGGGTNSDLNIGGGVGTPVIESNVYIGAKSTIAGAIRIGRGSLVGFHSLVLKDVPEQTVAMGTPAVNTRKIEPEEIESIIMGKN